MSGCVMRRLLPSVTTAAVVGLLPLACQAQLLDRYVPVGIPGYTDWFADTGPSDGVDATTPVRLGTVWLDPSLAETVGYDSNPSNLTAQHGSSFVDSNAVLHAGSDWSRNEVAALLSVDDVRYLDQPAQSYTTWTAAGGARLEIDDDAVVAAYNHTNSVSLPTEVGTLWAARPVDTLINDVRLTPEITLGRLGLQPGIEVSTFDYSGGGRPPISARTDDRTEYTERLALDYRLSGVTALVAAGQVTEAVLPNAAPGEPRGNSTDFSLLFGVDYRPAGVIRARALVGYEQIDYQSNGLSGASSPAAELDVTWLPTHLTTVTGRVLQSIENSPGTLTGDFTYTNASLTVSHSYSRTMTFEAAADYEAADATSIQSRQTAYSQSVDGRWIVDRGVELALRYHVQELDSVGVVAGRSTRQVVTLGLTLRPGGWWP